MTLDNTSNELSIRTMSPDKAFEDTLRLKVDPGGDPAKAEGSAGVANHPVGRLCPIEIRHKFGFDMKTFHPVKVPFKPPRREPWRCLLCVPLNFMAEHRWFSISPATRRTRSSRSTWNRENGCGTLCAGRLRRFDIMREAVESGADP